LSFRDIHEDCFRFFKADGDKRVPNTDQRRSSPPGLDDIGGGPDEKSEQHETALKFAVPGQRPQDHSFTWGNLIERETFYYGAHDCCHFRIEREEALILPQKFA
jgi:hypothetical protein